MALVAALLALAACGTTKTTTDDGAGGDTSNGSPGSGGDPTAIIKSMRGGLVGGSIGAGLSDEREEPRARGRISRAGVFARAVRPSPGRATVPATYGQALAAQPYRVGSQDCRQYTQTVIQDGQSKIARGTACRNGDGSWTPLT